MIQSELEGWILFTKKAGDVMTNTEVLFNLEIALEFEVRCAGISEILQDETSEPEVISDIRQMDHEQKQALQLIEKLIVAFDNRKIKRHLMDKFKQSSVALDEERANYRNAINMLLFATDPSLIPRATVTIHSFRELLRLFLDKLNKAQSACEKCEAIETVLDWIAEAPRTFKRYLNALGIPLEGDFPKKFTAWPNDPAVAIASGAMMSTAFLL